MQNDSVQLSPSDHVKHVNNGAVSQESFQCGHCILIFKSKVYLFEHLNKVHGFDVDAAQRDAGLNSSQAKKISADNSRDYLKCQHCDFRTRSLDVLNEHVNRKCRGTSKNLKGSGNSFENTDGLTKQHDEAAGAEEISSVLSTSKNKPSSSKDLKTYKRPLQPITKYFSTPVSNEETPEMSADGTTGTLILQDSPSSSNPNSSGVFKVTAKSMIDITSESKSYLCSQTENFFTADMKPQKLREHFKETELDNAHKRTKKVDGHPVKKAKLDDVEVKRPEKETANKKLAFEFSEDEEEKKAARINGAAESPKMYSCKHCDYSNVDIASLSSHYQDDHPYIRCNAVYIQDSHDQSATFRCLKCPVEFLSPSDLKRHYVKNHPEAPDIFTMKSRELSLLFKCFVCQFTTNILKSLKNHYKENHATLEVDNSLLFCRYSVVGSQEESSHLNICENTDSPERTEAISSKSASCKDTEAAASPQHSGEDLYKCSKCKFCHKSAVVMQVHYQKYHPDKEVTIDKIKRSAQVTPEKSPNSTVKVATTQSSSDTSKEKKDKAKAQETNTSLSPKTKTVEPAEDGSKTKRLLIKRKRESSPPADSSFYRDTSDRSFSRHHNAKHSVHTPINTKESPGFSGEVQRKKHRSDAETSTRTSSPHSKTKKPSSAGASKNIYMHAENLFYCYKCNYGNPSIFGVMTHQAKTHQGINTSGKHVSTYSAVIREEIKKSKLNPKDSSFSTLLPLPLMNKGDEKMFFCHFCNYRKSTVSQVVNHYSRRHHGFEVLPSQIQQYTSMVLKETEKLQPKSSGNHQRVSREESPERRGENSSQKMKKLSEKLVVSASTSAQLTRRSLQCFRCTFSTQYVYMLKKHLRKIHNSKWTVTQVLRACFRKGMLQPGYHCELCVFSHDKAAEVYMHYKEHHQRSKSSIEFVSTRLYAGPVTSSLKEKKQKCAEKQELFDSYQVPLEFDKSFDDVTASPTLFKCPYCSASFNTKRGLTIHCGIKHVLTENSEEKQQEASVQTRVQVFKCLHCTYVSTSYHGGVTHTKMKHPSLSSRVDSLHVDSRHIKHCNDKRIGADGSLKLSGHMCGTCSKVCASPELLRKHCEKKHKEANCAFKPAAGGKRQLSILKASFLNKKIYTQIKCQHCSYKCSTKIALIRHVRVHHMNAVAKDGGYMCVLCSRPYYRKRRLSDHYSIKHGKDAHLKYFVPIYGPVSNSPNRLSTQQLQKPKTKQILVYKCPSCPYVNASYHGTLTHCQMKHPALTVRADELQTCEILLTNFVKCDVGKSSNERGYMCRKCPQIHASLKKLKMHCLKSHDASDASEITLEIEKLQSPKGSVSQASPIQNKTPERGHDGRSDSPEISPSNSPSGQKNMLYRCQLCNYKGYYRRYLQSHYKKAHKLDAQSVSKLLEKYNKTKKANVLPQSDQAATCKKCPNLTFKSSALLIEHYSSSHCILDFTVLSLGLKHKSTGAYKCVHCDMHLNGTRKLAFHLDRHKERRTLKAATASPEQKKSLTFSWNEDLPTLETTDELTKWNVTPARTFSIPASPLSSPSEVADVDRSEPESRYSCKQCRRTFMSLKGLRTHERSHAAMAAIKKMDKVSVSSLKEKMAKYVLYKPGTLRPYMCSFCPYRTPVMALLWSHFMKKHRAECSELDVDPAEPDNEESAEPADKGPKKLPKVEDDPDEAEESMYLEPPDVQRQLNHYNMMAQSKSRMLVQESKFTENGLYHCELCNFSSGHLSSIRRHYLNCHGKKMLRCKDCRFFTGLRKTLEMHMETGHSTCQSKPTHDKDLRCPFCLYQTKNKNNMIDHIILHREERVVPIEVRRPKLSRYLQGIVFRCHKCTFTSGTPDNLRLHMTKHDDAKPYKCRLCYFDCIRLSDLEAHLSDKHQVVRNHELVGQVSLDQLEASGGRRPGEEEEEEEEEPKMEQHNGEEGEDSNTDCNNTPIEADTHQKQAENSSGSDIQCEDANTTAQMKPDPQKRAETVGLQDTTTEQGTGNEGEHSDAEKETNERRGEDGSSAQQREEAASHCTNMLPLDEDGVQRTVKTEPDTESDDEPSHRMSTDEDQTMKSVTCERSSVNVSPSSAREESLDVAKCKEEQVQRNCDEIMECYGEMPVLENEYLKEERIALGCCKEEEEEEEYYSDQKQEIKVEDGDGIRCSDQDGTEESAEDSSHTQEKLYVCEFCGRNLTSGSELKHHIMRHGI